MKRKAASLIEVLVVIAIVGTLLSLLLPAVMMVRASALRAQSSSNLRQCVIALHHFADTHDGLCPTLDGEPSSLHQGDSLMFALLPYVEEENLYKASKASGKSTNALTVKIYLSPADFTHSQFAPPRDMASYAASAFVFEKQCWIGKSFPDGLSQTIAFAEHYAFGCQETRFSWFFTKPISITSTVTVDQKPLEKGIPVKWIGTIVHFSTNVCSERLTTRKHDECDIQ